MTGEPTHTALKESSGTVHPTNINYQLKSEASIGLDCYVQPVTQLYDSKKTTSVQIATTYDFNYDRKPSHATAKSAVFAVVSKYETQRRTTCKSMKDALYILQYAKRHQSNVEQ